MRNLKGKKDELIVTCSITVVPKGCLGCRFPHQKSTYDAMARSTEFWRTNRHREPCR